MKSSITLRSIVVVSLVSLVAVAGCQPSDPARQATTGAASGPDSVADAVSQPPTWYSRSRTLDLTGDGRPDTVRLQATGVDPDSLDVVLTLVVDGRERHREEWGSSYELALADSAARAAAGSDAILRAALDSVLASVTARPLADAPLMAEDSAALAGIEPWPARLVSFSYGYETLVRLAWDGPRERFVRLWSCC